MSEWEIEKNDQVQDMIRVEEIPLEKCDELKVPSFVEDACRRKNFVKIVKGDYVIYATDDECVVGFVKKYFDLLKSWNIKYVINHLDWYNSSIFDDFVNALLIYVHTDADIIFDKRPIIKRIYLSFGTMVDDPSTFPLTYFDVVVTNQYNKVIVGYRKDRNVMVVADITHLCEEEMRSNDKLAFDLIMSLMKMVREGNIDNIPMFHDNPMLDLVLSLPVEIVRINPININTKVCKEKNVDVEIHEDKIIVSRYIDIENDIVALYDERRNLEHYRIDRKFRIAGEIKLYIDIDGRITGKVFNGEVIIDGKRFQHPNVNDYGEVCTGEAVIDRRVDLSKELCEQVAPILDQLQQLLSIPSANAYCNDFINYVVDNCNPKKYGERWYVDQEEEEEEEYDEEYEEEEEPEWA